MTSATETADDGGATATDLSALHPDIVKSHVLTRLDGTALASAACCSTDLRRLSSEEDLWATVCRATWPSTSLRRLSEFVSAFPNGGARAFFSHAFRIPADDEDVGNQCSSPPPPELISAVDIFHGDKLIFSKVQETETVTGWFRCSPFRIDLLDPKDLVLTPMKHPQGDQSCKEMMDCMTLSWILIDPIGRRAVNLSSHSPVAVHRHWLTGDVQVRYAAIISRHVQCAAVVTCGGSEGGEMQVREVNLEMEEMDGTRLNGKDSLVFLHRALEGKRGTGKNKVQLAKRRYNQFLETKRQRKERMVRTEEALDMFCVAFGLSTFVAIWCFLLCT
ncbi:probable F-box protein At2g36090 [Andrographis paniculata]|uniref:probable F-box protein At2g36090 n=1 Tax=Andrographis paniculata TaxID=175694 RepID=UPI0021E7D09B|nr:probable F-box protein At2g36090 [Andrographis paniculata]